MSAPFPDSLNDLEPYILGKKFSGKNKKTVCMDKRLYEDFMTQLEEDPIAKQFFDNFELYKDFFDTMVDFKEIYPKEFWEELFYAAKLGGDIYRGIPNFCVYMLKKAWKEANGIPNLIIKLLPKSLLKLFTAEGYFIGGITLQEVIMNVCTRDYVPLSMHHLKNKVGDFVEIYVATTDMVAAVPEDIANQLGDDGIIRIEESQNGLVTNGILLRTMCNRLGCINSTYDLRDVF